MQSTLERNYQMIRYVSSRKVAAALTVLAALAASALGAVPASASTSTYDSSVLADQPAAFWTMGNTAAGTEPDLSGSGLTGTYSAFPTSTTLPNGDSAAAFNGSIQYMEAADAPELSPATNGVLTIEAWMRPDTLTFTNSQNGYVHWMGKGEPDNHEFVSRMYSADNTVGRANRISGYLFNASGGLGAGSYFQDPIVAGNWIHYVLVINYNAKSTQYPHGYTKIYRDGVLRDQDDLSISGNIIIPQRGNAPFRVATRDFGSYFKGAVGKVAVYDKELSSERITQHYGAMTQAPDTTAPTSTATASAAWPATASGWYTTPVQFAVTATDNVDLNPGLRR
jgi:hypothetical protein